MTLFLPGPGEPNDVDGVNDLFDGDDQRVARRRGSRVLRASLVLAIVIAIVVPGGAVAYGIFHQRITDQLAVWQYTPTAEVAQMAADSGMNDEGRFYFYASAPTVESAADFSSVCGSSTDDFVLLGCYTGSSIHVFNVTDARLAGVRNVTAAHEMLHAVYARLSDDDRTSLDALLEAQYQQVKDDPDLAARMKSYATSEPGERDNELHSIFGTELASLSPNLEAHYTKYFSDRAKVVADNAAFQAVFTQVQNQEKALAAQLTAAGDAVDSESTAYSAAMSALNADIASFNTKADDGAFSSQSTFTAARNALTARGDALTARYQAIQADIAHYDDLRKQLEAVDSQASELNRSIDSSLQTPAPTAG
ncbi:MULTISPECIES: hypothetical protein [Subtercola]|uniref:Uncharacterized protein n=1 Tax=Subtercola vilae TaxID=2056433 RepID=A0A4T2C3V4_9MICO|nr:MULTISPECIES: hypothetical protein [Subtercola]MEA9984723.1 hypothetical protein [Subtercola sp. RTI3]TIH39033.1 hypothetical protein D4765_05615 [Subtercola vilae]